MNSTKNPLKIILLLILFFFITPNQKHIYANTVYKTVAPTEIIQNNMIDNFVTQLFLEVLSYFETINILISIVFLALLIYLVIQKRQANALNKILNIEKVALEINRIFNNNFLDKAIEKSLSQVNQILKGELAIFVDVSLDEELFIVKKTTIQKNKYLIEYLQELHFITNVPIYEKARSKHTFQINNIFISSNLPTKYPHKIKSALFLPIVIDDKIANYVVVLSDNSTFKYSQEKMTALDLLSASFSNAIYNNLASNKEIRLESEVEEKNQELKMLFNSVDFELLKINFQTEKIEPILTSRVNINPSSTIHTFIKTNFHQDFIEEILSKINQIQDNTIQSIDIDCKMLKSPYQEEFYWVNLQIFSEMHGVFKFDDTAYILIKNIDQRKKNEFLIEERNQKLNHILENSSSPIVEFDKNTKFIYINKPAKEILGIKPEELENANYKDYVHPDDLDSFSDIENSVKNNIIYSKPFTVTNRIKTVNQGYRWYEWNVNVMYENGEILRRISVGRDVTEQLDQQDKINYEITHDPLTGLYNSNYLKEQLTKIGENEFTFCVFINIDNFRRINDSFGHKFGDEFLVQFSKRLKLMIPDRYVKLIAHVSGDEFAILSNLKSQKHNHVHEDFEEYLEKINLMPITCFGEQIPFTISVGYAEYPYSTTDPTEIFRFSEIAMFEAKKNKRNGIATFDKSLYKKRVHAQMITKEVQYSNFSNDFFLVFHPITNFENENLVFFEALLRWKHPEKGVVSPSEFIDIIEQSGQLIEISRVMIHKLCHQIMDWSKLTDKEIAVSYNLSVASLRIKDEAEYIINELKQHNIPGDKLIIEITESLFYEENISIKNNISQLKEYGIKIAIDDFGMNFSTLSMLDRIAYDIIKIDMYFTQNINNPTSNMLIQMIHNIASINNKRCIVEGIESIDQYNLLKEIGITEFQGHYFSKPLTEEDITHNLQKYQSIYQKQKQK